MGIVAEKVKLSLNVSKGTFCIKKKFLEDTSVSQRLAKEHKKCIFVSILLRIMEICEGLLP